MDNIEVEIRNNLYEFYDCVAHNGGIYSEKQDCWSVIKNVPKVWPRIIYRINTEIVEQKSSIIFSEKVKSGSYPELLISEDENIQQIDPFFRTLGFYPFSAWKGMAIRNMGDIVTSQLPETVQIVRCENSDDIEQWIQIVTSELITPVQFDKVLLENLIDQSGVEVYLLKYNGKGVSTMLVFSSETSTGLYFIATQKSAQRQGFAKLLVQQILSQNARKSKLPVILHATKTGEALYSKLGFLPFNQFFLYRYINANL
ncbi:MAG: GNAT family N-acetyltransferase [Prolixibacteraceae bacterium]|nr:GNAT family N-acetyltransferase [Prolixibacteraceae bacterium]